MKKLLGPRVLAPSLAVGVIVGVVLWFVGAPAWWAVATGLVAAAAIALWRGHPSLEEPIWGKPTRERVRGARDDVQVLGWAVTDLRGHIQPRALDRVRGVARDRLAQRGLDLDAASDRPAIEALIGRRAYATLHSSLSHMPSQAALLASLDALDRVGLPGAAPR